MPMQSILSREGAMNTGRISLEALYTHASNDLNGESIRGDSSLGREYGRLASSVVLPIPETHGFYLWGKYEKNKLWRTIYLGKAGYGKTTSLRARIKEELKDEKAFLWHGAPVGHSEQELMAIAENCYPSMWHKYQTHFIRAIRKSGTTHILWVGTQDINNEEVIKIEADLIETLNPVANVQRPSPVSDLQDITVEIIRQFKHQIHLGRQDGLIY